VHEFFLTMGTTLNVFY